jgi:uncharacterized membrane protein YkoI
VPEIRLEIQIRFVMALVTTIFYCATMLAGDATAQEKKLKKSELPAAVQKTVDEQTKRATAVGFSSEKENGKTTYEAEFTIDGKSRDISMDASGVITEVEDQVDFATLPDAVQAALKQKAGAGKILKVESLTKKDKLVAYEAVIETAGKKKEVQVGPDGKPLKHEE